ncbi:hypothetical protein E2C01_060553 [Portunus trituberculatus]|uniref:Uncharacterized protein n=1 Tax=Portunus trituberculatus TaxID=210409 RepID=A0A5B7H905_PORTR|nr:hypothetical protein [Portunus trituberculatus]
MLKGEQEDNRKKMQEIEIIGGSYFAEHSHKKRHKQGASIKQDEMGVIKDKTDPKVWLHLQKTQPQIKGCQHVAPKQRDVGNTEA